MPELRDWLFALCVGVASGASWALLTYAYDFVAWHVDLLVALLREATR